MFEARHLWKVFGKTVALRDINLGFGGGLHILLGPNGSGKTTLLKLWTGLLKPTKGEVKVKNLDPWSNRATLMRFMGVAFEDTVLPWWTSGKDYLKFLASQKRAKWSLVVELAERLGVTAYWTKTIRGYSSGMRKKIVLLAALAGEPEILVLDEPYTLLDRNSVDSLNQILVENIPSIEAAVIASHVFTGIEERTSSIAVLVNGSLVFYSTGNKLADSSLIMYECETEDPVRFAEKLYKLGVKHLEIRESKVYFEAGRGITLPENVKCSPRINIKKVYENVVMGHRDRTLQETAPPRDT